MKWFPYGIDPTATGLRLAQREWAPFCRGGNEQHYRICVQHGNNNPCVNHETCSVLEQVRGEVVLMGTRHHNPLDPAAEWREYEFKCKPGDIDRRPCLITPYHYRLDWLMWFAAFQNYQANPWLVRLATKLLDPREETRARVGQLLASDPFMGDGYGQEPPLFIKADLYHYKFTPLGVVGGGGLLETAETDKEAPLADSSSSMAGEAKVKQGQGRGLGSCPTTTEGGSFERNLGTWWTRERVREYMPPISLENESVLAFLRAYGLEG
ncbi:unnamed protein product [Discosporangium mesarthrocarpum]